jgi:hypothetical protein
MSPPRSPSHGLLRLGRGRFASERGVALIEFALVLPFLLLVVFGMVDLGKAVNYWNDETHLANQAARYASVNRCSPCVGSTINSYVLDSAATKELKDHAVLRIEFGDAAGKFPGDTGYAPPPYPFGTKNHCAGKPVKVTVSYDYDFFSFAVGTDKLISPLTKTISSSSTQRIEKPWGSPTGTYQLGIDKYQGQNASPDDCAGP